MEIETDVVTAAEKKIEMEIEREFGTKKEIRIIISCSNTSTSI
jgi:hypothetical protein